MTRQVKGVFFPYFVGVGGGVYKTAEALEKIVETDVIPEWGSIETEPSSGNGGRDYHVEYDEQGNLLYTQNSRGIPNPGMAYVEKHASKLLRLYEQKGNGKPLILNISGKSVDDTLSLMKRALKCGFRVVTVNGACPNKDDQPILCDDTAAVDELYRHADAEIGETDTVFFWKISTGMRRPALTHNRERFRGSKVFSGIITGNTVPNTLGYRKDGFTTILTEKNKITRGGMGGPAIHPIALDHTEFCAQDLPEGKIVIGCGGAGTVARTMGFLRAGASMVQIVSAFMNNSEDPGFITDHLEDLHLALEIA